MKGCAHHTPRPWEFHRSLPEALHGELAALLAHALATSGTISGRQWEQIFCELLEMKWIGSDKESLDGTKKKTGVSIKTRLAGCELDRQGRFDVVLCRINSTLLPDGQVRPEIAGPRVAELFNERLTQDALKHQVSRLRTAVLLRAPDQQSHLYFEQSLCPLSAGDLDWEWASSKKAGLAGRCRGCGQVLFNFNLGGGQLSTRLKVPAGAVLLETPFVELSRAERVDAGRQILAAAA